MGRQQAILPSLVGLATGVLLFSVLHSTWLLLVIAVMNGTSHGFLYPAASALAFDRAPSGVPGVETMLPLLLARVRSGELDLATLVSTACDRPARWFGQSHGRIAVGHRANLIVVDFKLRTKVEGKRLHSPCGWTPFEGSEGIRPREHYRDGERIVEDGEFIGRPTGKVVRPEYALGESGGRPSPSE